MGRIYHRRTERGADGSRYTAEALARAISDVKEGKKTVKGASKAFNIPRTTLRHRLNATRVKGRSASGGSGGGRSTDIAFEIEQRLANSFTVLEKWGFGLTRSEVLDIVQIYVKTNNLKTRFKDGRPGEEWYLGFTRRHRLSLKKPQNVEYTRMQQVNPFVIYSYFDQLTETIQNLKLENKPNLIFNLDESSFCHDPSKSKVVGAKGARSTRMISSPGRENTSILICCSASGGKIPPLVIFKGKNILEHWLNVSDSDKTFYAASQRGWMETMIFSKWFKDCFLPNAPKERPLLLVYDGHSTHVSVEIIEHALANEVTILKLPPHTTHILQPLDVAVFKSMKNSWEKELLKWQRQNPRQRIPKPTFVAILNKIYDYLSPEVIINGFKATGIYPVSRDVIKKDLFKPDDLRAYEKHKIAEECKQRDANEEVTKDREAISTILKPVNLQIASPHFNISELDLSKDGPSTSGLHLGTAFKDPTPTHSKSDLTREEPSTSAVPLGTLFENSTAINSNKEKLDFQDLGDTTQVVVPDNPQNSFEKILLSFIKGNPTQHPKTPSSRKRICSNAEIITTQDYLEKRKGEEEAKKKALEVKEAKKRNVLEKKQKKEQLKAAKIKKKKKSLLPSSSESDSDISIHEAESDSDKLEDKEDSTVEVLIDDYVIVSYEFEYYPGQVIEITDENPELVKVKHMEKSGKVDGWKWPKKDDILTYELKEIIKVIPPPTPINNRGVFKIPALNKLIQSSDYRRGHSLTT